MEHDKIRKQIAWLEEQVTILEPSGTEATVIPLSILEDLKALMDKTISNSAGK